MQPYQIRHFLDYLEDNISSFTFLSRLILRSYKCFWDFLIADDPKKSTEGIRSILRSPSYVVNSALQIKTHEVTTRLIVHPDDKVSVKASLQEISRWESLQIPVKSYIEPILEKFEYLTKYPESYTFLLGIRDVLLITFHPVITTQSEKNNGKKYSRYFIFFLANRRKDAYYGAIVMVIDHPARTYPSVFSVQVGIPVFSDYLTIPQPIPIPENPDGKLIYNYFKGNLYRFLGLDRNKDSYIQDQLSEEILQNKIDSALFMSFLTDAIPSGQQKNENFLRQAVKMVQDTAEKIFEEEEKNIIDASIRDSK